MLHQIQALQPCADLMEMACHAGADCLTGFLRLSFFIIVAIFAELVATHHRYPSVQALQTGHV